MRELSRGCEAKAVYVGYFLPSYRAKPHLRLDDAAANLPLFLLRARPRRHRLCRTGRAGPHDMGPCRCRCDRGHAGAGLSMDVRRLAGGASALSSSSDREIERLAAAGCRIDYGLHPAILRAARSRTTKSSL